MSKIIIKELENPTLSQTNNLQRKRSSVGFGGATNNGGVNNPQLDEDAADKDITRQRQ